MNKPNNGRYYADAIPDEACIAEAFYSMGRNTGKSLATADLMEQLAKKSGKRVLMDRIAGQEVPSFTWTEQMHPSFINLWRDKLIGFMGEAKPRLQIWKNSGYPYWVEPDWVVYSNGERLHYGLDYHGRLHNGFPVKRSAFLGCYQFGVTKPSYVNPPSASKAYSRELFTREMLRKFRGFVAGMTEVEWDDAIANGTISISECAGTVSVSYPARGGIRYLGQHSRRR